ncbi:AbrB/MazE/SpoVT family DNA-binding domain-containing protein [Thermococcus sp. SY098]|uniref:AbrB/MazE/SpoVT family DNA-binding domain-containing protein n=1 Tax=Thermococcus sp. SY098 TaxID=3111325 RepID=UPI002D795771|nr:AbrB/MazE/SpoVT family DNA-binding domain-containing protein [Thermococcus sp. SY098]WRS51824.1 AbrB/MazE/SpoVT family DNA-binding domain-containing protein [Thermococcus sp. SY098]
MPENQQIIEPLAKFHVPVISKFRVVIPEGEKELFGLNKGTYIEIIIRKINPSNFKPLKRVHTLVKLTSRGMFTINKQIRQELDIEIGDILEILLINYYTLEDLVKDEYKHLLHFVENGFEIIDEHQEREILNMHVRRVG